MPPPADLPADAARKMAGYEPRLASPEHAGLIRDAVAWYQPKTANETEVVAAAVSGLVYWAEQTGRPVDPDELLAPAVVDSYISQERSLAETTKAPQRSMLHRIVRHRPGPHAYQRPPSSPQPKTSPPYTDDEIDRLLVWAAGQPSDLRRHAMLSLFALGFGAGLAPQDIRVVRGTDIARDAATDAVLVHVRRDPPRHVPLLARYEDLALDLAAAAGDRWIVNPGQEPRPGANTAAYISQQFVKAKPGDGVPPAQVSCCRSTWLCHHLTRGVRIDVLAAAAGLTESFHLSRYTEFLPDPPAAEVLAQLRDAPGAGLAD